MRVLAVKELSGMALSLPSIRLWTLGADKPCSLSSTEFSQLTRATLGLINGTPHREPWEEDMEI